MNKRYAQTRRIIYSAIILTGTLALTSCGHNMATRHIKNQLAVGMGHMDYGHHDMARKSFQDVLKTNPQNPVAHYELGRLEALEGNTDKAATEFREVLKTQPNNASAHLNLGWVLISVESLPEAEQQFKRALTLKEEVASSYAGLGAVQVLKKSTKAAKDQLSRALSVDPKNPMAHHLLAVLSPKGTTPKIESKEFLPFVARVAFKKYSQVIPDVIEKRYQEEEERRSQQEG